MNMRYHFKNSSKILLLPSITINFESCGMAGYLCFCSHQKNNTKKNYQQQFILRTTAVLKVSKN